MQPELSTTSTPSPTQTSPADPSTTNQHGLYDHDTGGVALPPDPDQPGLESGAGSAADQLALDAALAASLQEIGGGGERRMSPITTQRISPPPPTTPPTVARNKIEEYEKASTAPVTKKLKGPAFEVVKKPRAPGDERCPVADLPNGMVIQIRLHAEIMGTDNRQRLSRMHWLT
jgi:hypothetical protein